MNFESTVLHIDTTSKATRNKGTELNIHTANALKDAQSQLYSRAYISDLPRLVRQAKREYNDKVSIQLQKATKSPLDRLSIPQRGRAPDDRRGCIPIPGIDTFMNCKVKIGKYGNTYRNRRLQRVGKERFAYRFSSIGRGRRMRPAQRGGRRAKKHSRGGFFFLPSLIDPLFYTSYDEISKRRAKRRT